MIVPLVILAVAGILGYQAYKVYYNLVEEKKVLKAMVARLEADSRIAEALVTAVKTDPQTQKEQTTIKFLEYDSLGNPLQPKYFTFNGNIIQFQSLVVRFEDELVRKGDALKGKSVYLFMKAFLLKGKDTEEFEITKINDIPSGYKLDGPATGAEKEFWKDFWDYVFKNDLARKKGIKNAQIEAPGTKFLPGYIYTLKIEHDGGIRIDVNKIPGIFDGETIQIPEV